MFYMKNHLFIFDFVFFLFIFKLSFRESKGNVLMCHIFVQLHTYVSVLTFFFLCFFVLFFFYFFFSFSFCEIRLLSVFLYLLENSVTVVVYLRRSSDALNHSRKHTFFFFTLLVFVTFVFVCHFVARQSNKDPIIASPLIHITISLTLIHLIKIHVSNERKEYYLTTIHTHTHILLVMLFRSKR